MLPAGTGLKVVTASQSGFNFIALNKRFPPLDNKDFRYGLAYAFNYGTFVDEIYNGFAERQYGIVSPVFKEYSPKPGEIFTFDYDLAKAKEYFLKAKAAGAYKDGVTIWYGYSEGDEARRRGGLLFKDAVESLNVGVTIDVRALAWPEHLRHIINGL